MYIQDGPQPIPSEIKVPWKLEIPKRRAAIHTSSSGSADSSLGTQQQHPKLLLLPNQAMSSDLHQKDLSDSNGCVPQLQESNESTLQVSTEAHQKLSIAMKVSVSREIPTAMTSTEISPVISANSKGPADNRGGLANPSGSNQAPTVSQSCSDSSEMVEDCPTGAETAVGCPLQPAPASMTEGEATSLPVLFSEDEEEDCGGLLSSQMSRKIEKVQVFLKMDRLRRPKPFRASK